MLITTSEQYHALPIRPAVSARKLLRVSPEHFTITRAINAHMEGSVGSSDAELARAQWDELGAVYRHLADEGEIDEVATLSGVQDLEDMVFCANQCLPWQKPDGERIAIISQMNHPSRQPEVAYFEAFFRERGYRIEHLTVGTGFEGMGDAIPHPERYLLFGGHGFRTQESAWPHIARILDVPVVPLKLVSPYFYHLDTCFLPLNSTTVLLCPEAFDAESLAMLLGIFPEVVAIPLTEARTLMPLNAHLVHSQQRTAILHPGSTTARNALLCAGYRIIEVDTSEYLKSGGSVFCMKVGYY